MVDSVIRKFHVLYEDGPDLGELLAAITGKNKEVGAADHQEEMEKEPGPDHHSEEDKLEVIQGITRPGRIFS